MSSKNIRIMTIKNNFAKAFYIAPTCQRLAMENYSLICATVTPDGNSSEGGWNADHEVDGGAGEI